MNDKERAVMQQALEALEKTGIEGTWLLHDEAITALREALAAQAKQEPVAWLWVSEHGSERLEWEPVEDTSKWKSTPLYAAPVRTKDLTDDEIAKAIAPFQHEFIATGRTTMNFARAVIAADREKNK